MRWLVGGILGFGVGAAAFILSQTQPELPVVAPERPAVPAAPEERPVEAPITLPTVVEVLDLSPLLDPPASAQQGVSFEAEQPARSPIAAPPTPASIPLAKDE